MIADSGSAVTELTEIVGRENVLSDGATLASYASDCSLSPARKPWCVVKPRNSGEVQAIVRWANRTDTPLVPVSSGPPRFNGDTVPAVDGAVIVDLSQMNKMLWVDKKHRIVVFEAGMTWGQLQPALAEQGLSMSGPLSPRANKSVLTTLLERSPLLSPRYQYSLMEPLRCTEIVWGNGDIMGTGEAAVPIPLEKRFECGTLALATGPASTDFYRIVSGAQGTMGIVTWCSARCHLTPKAHKFLLVQAPKVENLIDCAYRVLRFRFHDEIFIVNAVQLATVLGKDAREIDSLKDVLPAWMLIVGVAGHDVLAEERVQMQEEGVRDIAQMNGLEVQEGISGVRTSQIVDAVLKVSPEPYWKLRYKGATQDIFFNTTLDKTPGFIALMLAQADAAGYESRDVGVYLQPQHQGVSCHCEFDLPYDPADAKATSKAKDLYSSASVAMANQGGYFSRPYGIWADIAYNRDPQGALMLQRIKGIFDPKQVMNPGKLCFQERR